MNKFLPIAFAAILFGEAWAQEDQDSAIHSLVQNMETAWTTKDASRFALNFNDDHDFIVGNGMYSPNITVEANKNGHEFLFSELEAKTKIKYVVDKISYLAEDIALVHILGCTYKKENQPLPYPTQIQTWVLTNVGNSWKIKSLHSTDIEYEVFIHQQECPENSSSEDQKTAYAREFYKSYYRYNSE